MSIEEIVVVIQKGRTERKEKLWQAIYKLLYKFCNIYTYAANKRGYIFEDLVSVTWFGVTIQAVFVLSAQSAAVYYDGCFKRLLISLKCPPPILYRQWALVLVLIAEQFLRLLSIQR